MAIVTIYLSACYVLMIGLIFAFGWGVIDRKRKLSWIGLTITALFWPVVVTIIMLHNDTWDEITGSAHRKLTGKSK